MTLNTIIEEEKMSTVEEVVAEFQSVHDTNNIWKDETGETAFVPIGNLEEWIRQLVINRDAHWQHAMQRAYEAGQSEERAKIRDEVESLVSFSDEFPANEDDVLVKRKDVLAKLTPDKTGV